MLIIIESCYIVQCNIKDGGLVPKSLYRSLEFSEAEESWSSEIYQTTHVSKGSPHEVRDKLLCFFSRSMKFVSLLCVILQPKKRIQETISL